ncbi:hypothetical protein Thiofri_01896 [Thiorhodovibrio frisius]|nr:hypothetical protein Thiofri_01896 [Thiorhodovibrio frisius]
MATLARELAGLGDGDESVSLQTAYLVRGQVAFVAKAWSNIDVALK